MAMRINRDITAFDTSRRAKESKDVRDSRHLAWIRTLPSVVSGRLGCEAAHISFADRRFGKPERARGRKAGDDWVLPLTAEEHRTGPEAQHRTGKEREWWESRGIDATTLATRLWAVSGDTEAAIRIINQAKLMAAEMRRHWKAGPA
ncbi:hypothetical protein [Shinella zoogloeoides]|uniref:hypothetical protein n=1 Tax=Shinella zoogloeoides TaxID=352475 RepID=UPI00299F42A4|nr:hypothetical protein [Shinella zoogloeoides]WPE19850.1 hypothetical protein ShzoTeo12_10260 [Shinella zoogloeoides]